MSFWWRANVFRNFFSVAIALYDQINVGEFLLV